MSLRGTVIFFFYHIVGKFRLGFVAVSSSFLACWSTHTKSVCVGRGTFQHTGDVIVCCGGFWLHHIVPAVTCDEPFSTHHAGTAMSKQKSLKNKERFEDKDNRGCIEL